MGFEAIVGSLELHHFLAYKCPTRFSADEMAVSEGVRPRMDCEELVYPWAPGPLRLAVPLEVTLSLLGA